MNTGWIEKFKIPAAHLEQWKQEAGPHADLLSWCLLNGKINENEYLEWACRHYELPILESNFFSLQPDLDLWDRVHAESQWKAHLIPLHEWEGVLLIACVQPVQLQLTRPHRFVLAPASSLNFLWTTLGHSDVIKKPVLTAMPAPVVEDAPAGFEIKLAMDDAPAGFTLGGSTPPALEQEAPAGLTLGGDAPAGFTFGGDAPAGFTFGGDAPAGFTFESSADSDSVLGEETAPGVAAEEQMPDGFAKLSEPTGLNFTLGGFSAPSSTSNSDVSSQVGEETQDIPIEVTQDMPIEVTQDMPIELSQAIAMPPPLEPVAPIASVATPPPVIAVPPPIEKSAEAPPAIPPIPKVSIPMPPPKQMEPAKASVPPLPSKMPPGVPPLPSKPASAEKTAEMPPIPVPPPAVPAAAKPAVSANTGVIVPSKPAVVGEKHVAPGKPAVSATSKNVNTVDIPQSEDTPLPSRPGVTDFHECYTFEEATDLAFAQMKGTFQKGIMLVFQGGNLRPWKWTGNVQYAGKSKASYIDLGLPSIFRIPYTTSLPYHGYVTPNPVNDEFFKEFNAGVTPKHVTIMPLKVGGNIAGMLMGITDEKIDLRSSLRKMEGIAENVSQAFSRIRSHKVAG